MRGAFARILLLLSILPPTSTHADVAPGNLAFRSDLQLLDDVDERGLLQTTWPIPAARIREFLPSTPSGESRTAALQDRLSEAVEVSNPGWQFSASYTNDPVIARSFEKTARGETEATLSSRWRSSRWFADISITASNDPFESQDLYLDGTRMGAVLDNWSLSAGWQSRWWGPGWDGSLILSTNARPAPGVTVQRIGQQAFESRWLRWIGPWALTTFMDVLDDDRGVNNALLWGLRVTAMPVDGIEIGLSRTAQWCGSGRSCDLGTFSDVLLGNDNRGVNVSIEDEPGNQLAGFDIRARLGNLPAAVYAQWIGEDTRQGGPEIGSWLRQAGVETWGMLENSDFRLHFEVSDTSCREGGLGFSDVKPGCAYNHPIYSGGYRYGGRSIGHGIDGDGRSFSLGATLVQSADSSWSVFLRHMDINRFAILRGSRLSEQAIEITEGRLTLRRQVNENPTKLSIGYRRKQGAGATLLNEGVYVAVSWSAQ